MSIEFVVLKKENEPVFGDVDNDGFFIDLDGRLCQKVSDTEHNIIARPDGKPFADTFSNMNPSRNIKKVLEKVIHINF